MGAQLKDAGVVKSQGAFVSAARGNPKSNNIGPGSYRMAENLPAKDALARLLDRNFRVLARVVVPEGFTVAETLATAAEATQIPTRPVPGGSRQARASTACRTGTRTRPNIAPRASSSRPPTTSSRTPPPPRCSPR